MRHLLLSRLHIRWKHPVLQQVVVDNYILSPLFIEHTGFSSSGRSSFVTMATIGKLKGKTHSLLFDDIGKKVIYVV
jgi:hypothetical protein